MMLRQDPITYDIPYIPAIIDIEDINVQTGRLISIAELNMHKGKIDSAAAVGEVKCSKKQLGTNYSIAKIDDQYYAIYKGAKQDKVLGKGAFGSVKLAQNILDGTWVVIKSIANKKNLQIESHNRVIAHEVDNLKKANQFIGHYQVESKSKGLQDIIVMSLARGISVKQMVKHRDLPVIKLIDLAIKMVESAYEIQQCGLIHRDIKPANMLYNPVTGDVTFVDFGLTKKIDNKTKSYLGGYGGSGRYMAPEICSRKHKKREFNELTEVYALGVSLLECFQIPRDAEGLGLSIEFLSKVRNPFVRQKLSMLISSMVDPKPSKRPGFEKILDCLRTIRDEQLDLISKIGSLVYLDVTNYHESTESQRKKLFASFLNVDQVQLCSTDQQFDLSSCLQIKHELEAAGVFVASELVAVYEKNKSAVVDALKRCTANKSDEDGIIYSAYYIESLKSFSDDSEIRFSRSIDRFEIAVAHKELVVANISAQIERLHKKDKFDPRLNLLRNFRIRINNGDISVYRSLFSELRQLQLSIDELKKSVKPQRFARFFGALPTATKKVAETSKEIIDDLCGLNQSRHNH